MKNTVLKKGFDATLVFLNTAVPCLSQELRSKDNPRQQHLLSSQVYFFDVIIDVLECKTFKLKKCNLKFKSSNNQP